MDDIAEGVFDHRKSIDSVTTTPDNHIVTDILQIRKKIREQVNRASSSMSMEELEQKRLALSERPLLTAATLRDTAIGLGDPKFIWAQTDKIVGRTIDMKGGWNNEISDRKGRMVQTATSILHNTDELDKLELIFHADKPTQRIRLTSIVGPGGPMYLVDDGSHRVAGSWIAGLKEIPCSVQEVRYPLEHIAINEEQVDDWKEKIKLGLIDGTIDDVVSENNIRLRRLTVKSEVVPWIRSSTAAIVKISRAYEKLYPGSLDKLKIPKDALIDQIANNFYMAGRWEDWAQQNSHKSRDENGVVIY